MAHCPRCGAEVSVDARFCPQCGAVQPRRAAPREQLALPGAPWVAAPMLQPAGAGALPAAPAANRPLTTRQVIIAVGAVLLFLTGMFYFVTRRGTEQAGSGTIPVLGVVGEAVTIGDTALGVAFTAAPERVNARAPERGRYLVVGVVIGNRGQAPITLTPSAVALVDDDKDTRYRPVLTAWGTPEELNAGQYAARYSLSPRDAIAGLIAFDIPPEIENPRLLVRDLTKSSPDFTGAIDLTRQAERE